MCEQHSDHECVKVKVRDFACALEKYNSCSLYVTFEIVLAVIIIALQVVSLIHLVQTYEYHGGLMLLITLLTAYLATDFINGIVHMIVDNNTNYTSIVGPFIASFHVHHFKLRYTERHPLHLYFTESSHKFWLFIYLILLTISQKHLKLDANLNLGLVLFGILSSIAELSHYWCHNARKTDKVISFLQKYHVLLSLKHHRLHHIEDNKNYAFLNGMSDPLLNIIARTYFKGYKNNSDKHVALYFKNLDQHSAQ